MKEALEGSPSALLSQGWTRDTIKVGDRVKFRALIVNEAYKGLQLWTYSWKKVE